MQQQPDISIWWLPAFCMIALGGAYFGLRSDERIRRNPNALLRISAEIAVPGGFLYWVIVRHFSLSAMFPLRSILWGSGGWLCSYVVIEWLEWAVVMWPFSAWRLERQLKVPFWRSAETATLTCLTAAGPMVLVSIVWRTTVHFMFLWTMGETG